LVNLLLWCRIRLGGVKVGGKLNCLTSCIATLFPLKTPLTVVTSMSCQRYDLTGTRVSLVAARVEFADRAARENTTVVSWPVLYRTGAPRGDTDMTVTVVDLMSDSRAPDIARQEAAKIFSRQRQPATGRLSTSAVASCRQPASRCVMHDDRLAGTLALPVTDQSYVTTPGR